MPIPVGYGFGQDTDLQKLTDPNVDESTLTPDELNKRLQAFQLLGTRKGTLDSTAGIEKIISDRLSALGANSEIADKAKPIILQAIKENNLYPDSGGILNYLQPLFSSRSSGFGNIPGVGGTGPQYDQIAGAIDPLKNFANDQDTRNQLSDAVSSQLNAPDTAADVKRLQGLIGAQTQATDNQNSFNKYISGLPDALSGQENQMLNAYDQSQGQQFQDVLAPQMLESANARGALFSGDVGDLLASGAGNIQAGRESLQSQIEAQDNQFYFNAAYQNSLTQQLQGQSNYSNFLQGEQNKVLQQNANQFQTNQSQMNNANQQNVAAQQYQNQMKQYQQQMKMQQDYQNQQKTSGLYQQIGGIAGATIGTFVAPGAGTMAGYGIGSAIGGAGGGMAGGH